MLSASTDAQTREHLLHRLAQARLQTDELFHLVKPEAVYDRPVPERHRIIFYIGHLEAFDWNLFHARLLGLQTFHPEYDKLFAFGIDPVGGGLPNDQPQDWPELRRVQSYVREVRERLSSELEDTLKFDVERETSAEVLLNVAIEHRLMHAETLAYMLHQLPLDRKQTGQSDSIPTIGPVDHKMVEINPGSVTMGLPRDSGRFGWDNEYEAHIVKVPAFAIDRYKVTNEQFLEFLRDGGYQRREFWNDADWGWKTEAQIDHPVFWMREAGQWAYRTMFAEIPLPPEWPVYVSHAEAKAYAQWAHKTLPTEEQWQRAALAAPDGLEREYPWGNQAPLPENGNFDFQRWDPRPVNAFPGSRSAFGVEQMVGNGWEWTSTVFSPFPGFQPFAFYPGYSASFFDGNHYVMKGGSARTAACMLRRSFRNWFQPHYQYVYAGFRCASQ
jgi:ergothioneine biosynthesis protein EgtB